MLKYVFFDMDGTLLPMKQEDFVQAYFSTLVQRIAPLGYDPAKLVEVIWKGTAAMVQNDGSCTNSEAFWNTFCDAFGEGARADIGNFDDYYLTDFRKVKEVCGFDASVRPALKELREMGLKLVLASNPLFPLAAQKERLSWTGADAEDFCYFTHYENSRYCKPNVKYYEEIMDKLSATADQCLMAGNDVGEDMIARTLGMDVFLLPNCLINRKGEDISRYPRGDFGDLIAYVKSKLA